MTIKDLLGISSGKLIFSIWQSLYMVSLSLFIGTVIGIPLGIILSLSRLDNSPKGQFVFKTLNLIINTIRSVPFVILLIFIMPFTKFLIGTTIGSNAAVVPLIIYITPYLARLVEASILEVGNGIIEAAEAMGANKLQLIWYFIIPEALPSLALALTTGTIGLIGASAMAGTIGGGGIGDLALTYGYQRFNTPLMIVTVVILILFVQLVQSIGNLVSKKLRNHQ